MSAEQDLFEDITPPPAKKRIISRPLPSKERVAYISRHIDLRRTIGKAGSPSMIQFFRGIESGDPCGPAFYYSRCSQCGRHYRLVDALCDCWDEVQETTTS